MFYLVVQCVGGFGLGLLGIFLVEVQFGQVVVLQIIGVKCMDCIFQYFLKIGRGMFGFFVLVFVNGQCR